MNGPNDTTTTTLENDNAPEVTTTGRLAYKLKILYVVKKF
jgi:hypothetical protein